MDALTLMLAAGTGIGGYDLDTFGQLAGRLHPAVVHFPIAMLVTAGLAELFNTVLRRPGHSRFAMGCLFVGTVGAIVAAWFGWLNAGYEPPGRSVANTLFFHRWLGVGVAVVATLSALAALADLGGRRGWIANAYRGGLVLSVILVGIGGHLGGTLVYGEGYYLAVFETPDEKPARTPVREAPSARPPSPEDGAPAIAAVDFVTSIEPILDEHCLRCHGPRKQKGRLRLDRIDELFEEDPNDWIIMPGDAEGSELFHRVILPADDDDLMPADDEPLDDEEIELLRRWIDEGAATAATDTGAAAPTAEPPAQPEIDIVPAHNVDRTISFADDVQPILADRCFGCHGADQQKGGLRLDRTGELFGGDPANWLIRPRDPAASELLRRVALPADDPDHMPPKGEPLTEAQIATIHAWIEQGAQWKSEGPAAVRTTSSDQERRGPDPISLIRSEDDPAPLLEKLAARGAIAQRVATGTDAVHVNFSLAAPRAGDDDLAGLAGLEPTLVWLNLARSEVSDDGLAALGAFGELRRLHLENTAIGDGGLAHLSGLAHLEYLNLYGTEVTDDGLDTLATMPALERVYLWQTEVTPEGVEELRAARPDLDVEAGAPAFTPPPPDDADPPPADDEGGDG